MSKLACTHCQHSRRRVVGIKPTLDLVSVHGGENIEETTVAAEFKVKSNEYSSSKGQIAQRDTEPPPVSAIS